MSTCTCDINCVAPLGASTPNTSRKIVDCCTGPDLSIIENACSHSRNLTSNDSPDVDDDVIIQCTSCSTESPEPPPDITSSIRNYVRGQLNKTYVWTWSKPHDANKTCTLKTSTKDPKLEEDSSMRRLNKSCEFRPRTKDCCEPVKICARKRVDFASEPNTPRGHEHVDNKFCKTCNDIVNSAAGSSADSCKHIEIIGKLCQDCKELVEPCQPVQSSNILDHIYERCREILSSVSSQTPKPCRHSEVEHKMCQKCQKIIDSAPNPPVKSCKHIDVFDKLCKHCKYVVKSAPSRPKTCKHAKDNSCELCRDKCNILSPSCSKQQSEHMDRSCKTCFVIEPSDCVDKACDPVLGLVQSGKIIRLVDGSCEACQIEESSCKHVAKASAPAPCAIKVSSCKYVDKACDPAPFMCIRIADGRPSINIERSCQTALYAQVASCQTEPCKKVDKTCEPEPSDSIYLCRSTEPSIYVDAGSDPAPFQSIKFGQNEDKGCEPFVLKLASEQPARPCKQVRLQVLKKGECCKSFEELFFNNQEAGTAECSSPNFWKRGRCACALESQSAATLTNLCSVKSKQIAKSTSFENAKESMCRSSGPDSPDGSCASARARYYQNKLLATLQILQNKEETIRVQAESLAVAESRIAALSARHADLRREIERKEREIQCLRKSLKEFKQSKIEKFDVSMMAEESDEQDSIVKTLQNNLDIIEDLYRESFYETVKQENLIEMLRQSNLDIRLMEKDKSDRISKLHKVINTQQWSLDRCQDIASDVENLKMEISNFINSSNNDSGMWEESVVGGLNEDLQDIAAQLMRLRELLTSDCTCGLEEENKRLKRKNEKMQSEISDFHSKISALEANSMNNSCIEAQYREEIANKETEISCIREQLHEAIKTAKEKSSCVDMLTTEIAHTKATLDEKSAEMSSLLAQCRAYEETITILKEELGKNEQIATENVSLRSELCVVSRRAGRLQRRVAELEAGLASATDHCAHVQRAYRDKIANAVELERQLDEAHARGADLCAEAGRVVRAVRCWAARMKAMHREQEKQIKQKEYKLRSLQREIDNRKADVCPRVWEQREQCCSPRPSSTNNENTSCSKCVRISESCPQETCVRQRREDGSASSASEMASCSTTPACTPNRACLKKRPAVVASSCGIRRRYGWLGPFSAVQRDTSAQQPARRHAGTAPPPPHPAAACACAAPAATEPRAGRPPVSPGEEMFSRMERLSEALADGYKRWSRRAT